MPTNILMPALSPTMEKGNLAKWLKKEGDRIKSGDVIAEIETDKATMEVEAVDEGILARIIVPAGTADVPVNELIALIANDGEDPAQMSAGPAAPQPKAPTQAVETLTAAAPHVETKTLPEAAAAVSPPLAAQTDRNGARPDVGARTFASPLARRIASQNGIDLSSLQGSGPRGRVVEKDVLAAVAQGTAKPQPVAATPAPAAPAPMPAPVPPPAAAKPAAGMADDMIRKLFEPGSFEEIPHDGMRKTIARRLTESKQTVPHFYLSLDCNLDSLMALREQLNASAPLDKDKKPLFKLSVNDFVIKAMAVALMRVPDANASWTDSAMLKHRHADVGVAVAIPGGLITPIIRKAEIKTLSAISNEMKDLAARAKARKLKPEEYQGGTTAVSNLGMFGIKEFSAVINPPHATILAVGAGEQRAVVKNGAVSVSTVMTVTLSTDHRAVDGALGAELLSAFRSVIENPMSMLV
jgi:pyruvate dehydrogenase E2 component (dihydrolipoamide acetyltransferase)